MNAGLFRTASESSGLIPKLDLYIGTYVSGAFVNDDQESFDANFSELTSAGNYSITIEQGGQEVEIPYSRFEIIVDGEDLATAFGDRERSPEGVLTVVPRDENGDPLVNPVTGEPIDDEDIGLKSRAPAGLVETPVAPLIMPQVGIGTIFGTSLQLRYLPETTIDEEYGTIGIFGLAVQHSISQYIPTFPLDLAVQGAYSSLTLQSGPALLDPSSPAQGFSEVFDSSGWAFNVQASKDVPVVPIIFYGGLQFETFNTEYSYVFDPTLGGTISSPFDIDDPIEIQLDQTASNRVRGVAGFTVTVAFARFNVDYALSNNNAVTAGVGLQL
jgi:hypothetical protein